MCHQILSRKIKNLFYLIDTKRSELVLMQKAVDLGDELCDG